MSFTERTPQGHRIVLDYAQRQMNDVIGGRGMLPSVRSESGNRPPVEGKRLPVMDPLSVSEIGFGGITRVSLSPENTTVRLFAGKTYAMVGSLRQENDGTVSLQRIGDPTEVNAPHRINLGKISTGSEELPGVVAGVVKVSNDNNGKLQGRILPDVLAPQANLSAKTMRRLPAGSVVVIEGRVDRKNGSSMQVYVGGKDGQDRRKVKVQNPRITRSSKHGEAVGDHVQESDAVTITGVVRKGKRFFSRKRVEVVDIRLDAPSPQRASTHQKDTSQMPALSLAEHAAEEVRTEASIPPISRETYDQVNGELEALRAQVRTSNDSSAAVNQLAAILPALAREGNNFAAGQVLYIIDAALIRQVPNVPVNTGAKAYSVLRRVRSSDSNPPQLDNLIAQGVASLRSILTKNSDLLTNLSMWEERFGTWLQSYPQLVKNADWQIIAKSYLAHLNRTEGRHAAPIEHADRNTVLQAA